jgi:hypothetical protein
MSSSKPKIKTYKSTKNFYEEYIDAELPKLKMIPQMVNNFKEKLDLRVQHLRDIYHLTESKWSKDKIIDENFVKIFSHCIITKDLIDDMATILYDNKIFVILDPCCGNGFHMYLFRMYTRFCVVGIDINPEPCAWVDILAGVTIGKPHEPAFNCLEVLPQVCEMYEKKKGCTPKYMCLFLSSIDKDDLALELVNMFEGNIVVSIGNPRDIFIDTYKTLDEHFEIIKEYKIKEPWNTVDNIEIFRRINLK